jgi:hypothetical protein
MLFDWPSEKLEDYQLDLNDPVPLGALQDENFGYSLAQISPGYMNVNLVAFYLLKGKKLFLFHGEKDSYSLPRNCHVFNNIEPNAIQDVLNKVIDVQWLLMVTSGTPSRNQYTAEPGHGVRLQFFVHANTLPKPTHPVPKSKAR